MKKKIINDTLGTFSDFGIGKQFKPSQYDSLQKRYYMDESRLIVEQMAKYSSDFVEAQVQGLNPDEPFEYTTVHMRLSNAMSSSASISSVYDNYKNVEIAERQYTYIRRGAKIMTMGSVWLSINPDNMSNVQAQSIIQRCDNTWNHLDFYGNIVREPVCIDRLDMRGVDPDSQRSTMINTGYYAIKVQLNEDTKQLGNNSRLLLGGTAFMIAGYAEISNEFTFDDDTVNLLVFRAKAEEPNMAIDDMENRVAGGKTFAWDITVSGEPMVMVGAASQLTASSVRTSEEHTEAVTSTEEHPVSYLWESSNTGILTVSSTGVVVGVSEGSATVTCFLEQNPSQSVSFDVKVQGDATEPHLAFTTTIPPMLGLYQTATITAKYYENGTAVPLASFEWAFSGADPESYSIEYEDIDTITVKCWSGSIDPLTITVSYENLSISGSIELEGI